MSLVRLDELSELSSNFQDYFARTISEVDGKRGVFVLSIPVPFAPLSVFLRALPRDMSLLWDPAAKEPFAHVGSGVAHRIDLRGRERFTQMNAALDELWRKVHVRAHPDCTPPPPRVFGGVAFEPGLCSGPPWTEFSDGCFVLSRWTYSRSSESDAAILSLAVDGERDRGLSRHQEFLTDLDAILEALEAYAGEQTRQQRSPVATVISRERVRQIPFESWRAHIDRVQSAIRSGGFGKIVAARRTEVDIPPELQSSLDELDVLSRLSAEPGCTRYAFRGERSSFIGASPELLFAKDGANLKTQALAGTLRSLGSDLPVLNDRSSQLLSSEKDRAEHEFVVRQIRDSLAPLCSAMDIPDRPSIRRLRSILHLNTPISAELGPDVTAARLLAAMHPTPAVGGVPKREAAAWIAANEPQPRGWYTGAVGWVDATGDASFAVAIRCGLVTSERAFIFTGAGIVESSNAAAEYAETELKQLPMLRALGVEETVPPSYRP